MRERGNKNCGMESKGNSKKISKLIRNQVKWRWKKIKPQKGTIYVWKKRKNPNPSPPPTPPLVPTHHTWGLLIIIIWEHGNLSKYWFRADGWRSPWIFSEYLPKIFRQTRVFIECRIFCWQSSVYPLIIRILNSTTNEDDPSDARRISAGGDDKEATFR